LVHRTLKGAALAVRGPLGCLTVAAVWAALRKTVSEFGWVVYCGSVTEFGGAVGVHEQVLMRVKDV
jgi:hypothetical protein